MTDFGPDLIFIWHAIGIPSAVLATAEQLRPDATVYYQADYQAEIDDEYLAYWSRPGQSAAAKAFKMMLAPLGRWMLKSEGKPLRLRRRHVACVSVYVRDRLAASGHIPTESVVIRNGVDLSVFSADGDMAAFENDPIRLLYAGRLIREKGVHTMVEALAELGRRQALDGIILTLMGAGQPHYIQQLRARVDQVGLTSKVEFQPAVPRESMPGVLRSHDVLLLTSEYPEPLARSIQEAMAMGLLVIGTTTGGSGELLVEQETGLTFEAGNSSELADQLMFALADRDLSRSIARRGQDRVRAQFNIERTVAETDTYLRQVLAEHA